MDLKEDVMLGTLPSETMQMLQFSGLKRSLMDSLNQAQEVPPKNPKWGSIMASKYATRGHDNINIMEKPVAYKMKKKLEIPITYKGGDLIEQWLSINVHFIILFFKAIVFEELMIKRERGGQAELVRHEWFCHVFTKWVPNAIVTDHERGAAILALHLVRIEGNALPPPS
ncbi:hypothetical protein D1007_37537 [Hordeum vulgare]|nr:hypothetical protein D1007_37537 [Hordeum vulgare]